MRVRTLITVALVTGLVASAGLPAEAKKKKKAKPVATTLYMDGVETFGEQEQAAVVGTGYLDLKTEAGTAEKSMGIPNYTGGPNTNCAGNSLMPVFVGDLQGKIVGDMKVTFDAFGQTGQVELRVWPDVAAQACNEAYIEPAGSVVVDLPAGPGTVEATIEGLNFDANALLMLQITPVIGGAPYYARAYYGTDASKIEFSCIPAAGTSCTP